MGRGMALFLAGAAGVAAYSFARGPRVPPPLQPTGIRIEAERVDGRMRSVPPVYPLNLFEQKKDVTNWIGKYNVRRGVVRTLSSKHVSQGKHSMSVYWRTSGRAELLLTHVPSDWHRWNWFAFDVYNAGDAPLGFELRIGDTVDSRRLNRRYSRFLFSVALRPGWNRYRIPLSDIAGYVRLESERKIIRLRPLENERLFYIDNMRLEL